MYIKQEPNVKGHYAKSTNPKPLFPTTMQTPNTPSIENKNAISNKSNQEDMISNAPDIAPSSVEETEQDVDSSSVEDVLANLEEQNKAGKFDPKAFDFSTVKVAELKRTPRAGTGGRTKVEKQLAPNEGYDLRVFENGSVYPTQEIVNKLNLEYKPAYASPSNDHDVSYRGFGFDIIDPADCISLKTAVEAGMPTGFIILGHTPRVDGKVDIFRSTRYDEQENPKSTVLDQGAPSDLAELIFAKYGDNAFGNQENKVGYVDVKILTDNVIPNPSTGVIIVNKFTNKKDRDEPVKTYVNRKNTTMFPLDVKVYAEVQESDEVNE